MAESDEVLSGSNLKMLPASYLVSGISAAVHAREGRKAKDTREHWPRSGQANSEAGTIIGHLTWRAREDSNFKPSDP